MADRARRRDGGFLTSPSDRSGGLAAVNSRAGQDRPEAARLPSPEVSVICTARNAASTIAETIRSIQAQDIQNWEMIIIDDGSSDGTMSIVRAFVQADPRIRLVPTGGIGRGRALNRALAEAVSDLIANLDADDESHPYRLRCQLDAMKRHPHFALTFTEAVMVCGMARPTWPEIDTSASVAVTDGTRALAVCNPVVHSSVMMRKAVILGLGGYDEARRFVLDYDLWVRCAAAGLRLGRVQLSLVAKRIHPGQSYLHSSRLHYLFAGLLIQIRAMRVLGVGPKALPWVAVRLLWGLLPLRGRMSLRKLAFRLFSGDDRGSWPWL